MNWKPIEEFDFKDSRQFILEIKEDNLIFREEGLKFKVLIGIWSECDKQFCVSVPQNAPCNKGYEWTCMYFENEWLDVSEISRFCEVAQ